jgi:hypothetical protein
MSGQEEPNLVPSYPPSPDGRARSQYPNAWDGFFVTYDPLIQSVVRKDANLLLGGSITLISLCKRGFENGVENEDRRPAGSWAGCFEESREPVPIFRTALTLAGRGCADPALPLTADLPLFDSSIVC